MDEVISFVTFALNLLCLLLRLLDGKTYTEKFVEGQGYIKVADTEAQVHVDSTKQFVPPELSFQINFVVLQPVEGIPMWTSLHFADDARLLDYFLDLRWSRYLNSSPDVQLGVGTSYIPTTADVGACLKFSCRLKTGQEERLLNIISRPVSASLAPRQFFFSHPDGKLMTYESEARAANTFRVCSWNILADRFTTPEHFPYAPYGALFWEPYRLHRFVNEIKTYAPDILCLQEVEGSIFNELLYPAILKLGFVVGTSPVLNPTREGVCIAWRKDRFRCVRESIGSFSTLAESKLPIQSESGRSINQ